jgi:hypothetical protein
MYKFSVHLRELLSACLGYASHSDYILFLLIDLYFTRVGNNPLLRRYHTYLTTLDYLISIGADLTKDTAHVVLTFAP